MTTETTERAVPRNVPATAMPVGGEVVAVVPQSVEEIFRVSKGVVQSGLAPYALTGKTDTDEKFNKAVTAVAVVIMAGAELGLPPMVSLRSFTAINGRPALYGDGLINVVRRSGRASLLRVGYTSGSDYKLFIRAGLLPEPEDDEERTAIRDMFMGWPEERRTGGFCEATRNDTGETKVVIFTVANAMRAGLWQTETEVLKDVWEDKPGGGRHIVKRKVPNDSPWYRYPERMLGWRAAGFCLRDLFGDVLGGITDDWEAREIGGMVDITPQTTPPSGGRPIPPTPPAEEDENQDAANESEKPEVTGQGDGIQLQNIEHPAAPEQPGNPTQAGGTDGTSPTSKAEPEAESSPHTTVEPDGEQHVEEGEAPGPVEVTVVAAPTFEETVPTPPTPPAEEMVPDTSDTGRFLAQIDETLATATNEEEVDRLWDELDVQHEFADDEVALTTAFNMKAKHTERAKRLALAAAGQGDLLGGGNG